MQRVVVAGGGLAGPRSAEALRALGFDGELVVTGAEEHFPYNRPPLSKAMLSDALSAADLVLPRKSLSRKVSWRLGVSVSRADLAQPTVELSDDSTMGYDALIG